MRSMCLLTKLPVRHCCEDMQVRPVLQVWAKLRLRTLSVTRGSLGARCSAALYII